MSSLLSAPIKAVLFDLDGTLVHSNLDFQQIRSDISCPEGTDVLTHVGNLLGDKRHQAEQIIMQHEIDDARATKLIDGAIELLEKLNAHGIKTAIITRNSQTATRIKMQTTGLQVEKVLTREDAPAKPKPDALLHFSELWGFSPRECVYVGDYLYDLQAANNANMHACLYLEKAQSYLPDYAHLADFICRDLMRFDDTLLKYLSKSKQIN